MLRDSTAGPRNFAVAYSPSFNPERGANMQNNRPNPPKLAYSIREAVTATSLSKTTLYSAIAAQKLRVIRCGGRTLIPAQSLMAFLNGEG